MLIYIHGFNSSSQSGKAQEMAAWMAARGQADEYVCPDLPDHPAAAMALLEDLVKKHPNAKLIGSSLGGFYATYLAEKYDMKAILVNPCVHCHKKLAAMLGSTQKNWHTGTEYVFSAEHLQALQPLAVTPKRLANYLLLVETGDEVLDYREAVDFYAGARQVVREGGDHGFSRFTEYLPHILEF